MRDRTAPTHMMRIDVPLDLSKRSPDFDPIADALRLVLSVSRAAYSGEICDDPQVTMEILTSEPPKVKIMQQSRWRGVEERS